MEQTLKTLQQELDDTKTNARRRLRIGQELEKIGDLRPGVGLKDGLPHIAWLLVAPGGEIKITRHWRPETPSDEEKFIHIGPFEIAPFYIAKFPVTYSQYEVFVKAEDGYNNLAWWQGMPNRFQCQKLDKQRTPLQNNPRDNVSWYQSVAFARWMSHRFRGVQLPHPSGKGLLEVGKNAQIRLPTECEWQWAAQNGVETRRYPWGDVNVGYANTAELELNQATAVGLFPHGAAACGALDMAGNLMEWCANDKTNPKIVDVASTGSKVLRGGDWGYGLENASCIYCDDESPNRTDALNGCRLVLGVDQFN